MGTEPVTNAGLIPVKDVNDGANAIHKTTKAAVDDLGFNKPSLIKWGKWLVGKLGPFGYVVTIVLSPVLIPVSLTYDAGRGIKLLLRKITKIQEPVQKLLPMTAKQVEDAKKLEQHHKDLEPQHASEIQGLKDQATHQAQHFNQKLSREQKRNHELNILLERVARRGDDLEADNSRCQASKGELDRQLTEKSSRIDQLSKELEAARQQYDHTKEENIWARQEQDVRIRSLESKLSAEQKLKRELEARHQTEVCRLQGQHQFDVKGLEDQHRHNVQELELRHQDHMQALNVQSEAKVQELLREIKDLRELTEVKNRDHNNALNDLTNLMSVQRGQIRCHEEKEQQLHWEISHWKDLARQYRDNNNNAVNAPHAQMSDQTGRTIPYAMTDRNLTAELHRLLITHQGLPSDQPEVMDHQYLVQQVEKVVQDKTFLLEEQTHRRTQAEEELQDLESQYQNLQAAFTSEVSKLEHTISVLEQQKRQAEGEANKQVEESRQLFTQRALEFQMALGALANEKEELQVLITKLMEESQELEEYKYRLANRLEENESILDKLQVDHRGLLQRHEVFVRKEHQRRSESLANPQADFRQQLAFEDSQDSEDTGSDTEQEACANELQTTLDDRQRTVIELLKTKLAQVEQQLEVENTEIVQLSQQFSQLTDHYRHLEVQFEENKKKLQVAGMDNFVLKTTKKEVDELKEKLAEVSSSTQKESRDVKTSEFPGIGPRELANMASQTDIESEEEVTGLEEELATTPAQLKEMIRSGSEQHSIVSPSSTEKVSLILQTSEDTVIEPRELVHMAPHAGVEPDQEVIALKQELITAQTQLDQFIQSAREFQPAFPETKDLSSYGSSSVEEGSVEGGMITLAPEGDHSFIVGHHYQEFGHRTFNDPGEVRFKDLCIEKMALKKRLESMKQQLVQLIMDNDNLTEEKGGLLEQVHEMQANLQGFDSLKRGFTEATEQRDEVLVQNEAQKVVIESQDLRLEELRTELTQLEETYELELTDLKRELTSLDEKNKTFVQKHQKLLADRSKLEVENLNLQSNLIQAMTCSNPSNVNQGAYQEEVRSMKLEKEELDRQISSLTRELESVSQELREQDEFRRLELRSQFDSLMVEMNGEKGAEDDFFTEQEGSDVAEQVKQRVRTKFGEYKDENENLRNMNRRLAIDLAAQKLAEDAIFGALSSLDSKK